MKTVARFASGRQSLMLGLSLALLAVVGSGRAGAGDGGFLSNLGLLERLTQQAVEEAADSLQLAPGEPLTVLSQTRHEANWFVGNKMAEELARRGHPVRVVDWAGSSSGSGGSQAGAGSQSDGEEQTGESDPGGLLDPDLDPQAVADSIQAYADSVYAANYDPLWGELIEGAEGEQGAAGPGSEVQPGSEAQSEQDPGDWEEMSAEDLWGGALDGVPALPPGQIVDVRVVEFGVQYSDVSRKLLLGPTRFTRVGGVYIQVGLLRGPEGTLKRMVSSERHLVDRLAGDQRHLAEGAGYPFSPPALQPPSLGRYVEPAVVVAIVGSLVYLFYANQN